MAAEFPDHLLTRGFNQEHTRATSNLRHALIEVQRLTARILEGLDADPATATLSGDGRALVRHAGEVASHAAELEMANKLSFLLPTNTPEES